jgi:hypothetical protein
MPMLRHIDERISSIMRGDDTLEDIRLSSECLSELQRARLKGHDCRIWACTVTVTWNHGPRSVVSNFNACGIWFSLD